MAVLDFPSDTSQSPYEENGITYEWDGQKWIITSGGSGGGGGGDLTLQQVTDNGNRTTTQINVGEATNTDGRVALIAPDLGSSDARGRILLNAKASAAGGSQVLQSYHGDTETLRVSAGGSLYLGGDIQNDNGNIWLRGSNGEATFAGVVQSGGNADNGAESGTEIKAGGRVVVSNSGGTNTVFQGFTTGTSTATSEILANGSAKFVTNNIEFNVDSAKFRVDTTIQRNLVTAYYGSYADDNNAAVKISADPLSTSLSIKNPVALSSTTSVFEVLKGGSQSDKRVVNIDAAGSATFAGTITSPDYNSNSATGKGFYIDPSGLIIAQKESDKGTQAIWQGRLGSDAPTSQIKADGSATFASNNIELFHDGSARFAGDQFYVDGFGGLKVQRTGETAQQVQLDGRGNIFVERSSASRAIEVHNADDSSARTVTITGGGTASFAGSVSSDADFNAGGNIAANGTAITCGNNPNAAGQVGIRMRSMGTLQATNDGGAFLQLMQLGNTTPTVQINADGSASFATNQARIDSTGKILTDRRFQVNNVSTDIGPGFNVFEAYNVNSSSNPVIIMSNDGSSSFAGKITLTGAGSVDGIQFGSTDSGGAITSQTLDDYEEGTFTPVISDSPTGGNVATGGSMYGTYQKVGHWVTVSILAEAFSTSGMTASNTVHFQGLPFSSSTSPGQMGYVGAAAFARITDPERGISMVMNRNVGHATLSRNGTSSGNRSAVRVNEMESGQVSVWATLTYKTDA